MRADRVRGPGGQAEAEDRHRLGRPHQFSISVRIGDLGETVSKEIDSGGGYIIRDASKWENRHDGIDYWRSKDSQTEESVQVKLDGRAERTDNWALELLSDVKNRRPGCWHSSRATIGRLIRPHREGFCVVTFHVMRMVSLIDYLWLEGHPQKDVPNVEGGVSWTTRITPYKCSSLSSQFWTRTAYYVSGDIGRPTVAI